MQVGLRITVATARGAREGVPALLAALDRAGARGTFYFNFGPDRRRWWLPAWHAAREAAAALKSALEAGHEAGVYGWDPERWQRRAARNDLDWVDEALRRACDAFQRAAGEPPRTHAAPAWHTGRRAMRLTQRFGFDFATDTRGTGPFVPVCEAEPVLCPQLPTTLPTLDEAVAACGTHENAHEQVLAEADAAAEAIHVFSLRAEAEGMPLAPVFERLLDGWQARGCALVTLRTVFDALDLRRLPRCNVGEHAVQGCSGTIALQGARFLSAHAQAA